MHLFIEMPHDAVDVNVHPTKAEVRFRDQSYIHELVRRTLGDALGRGPAPELQLEAPAVWRRSPRRCRCRRVRAVYPEPLATGPASVGSRRTDCADGALARRRRSVAPTSVSPCAPTREAGPRTYASVR